MEKWCELISGNKVMKKLDALKKSLDCGKVRGYSKDENLASNLIHTQYALKKVGEIYFAYYFSINHKFIATIEDYEDSEEIRELATFEEAIDYFESRGADLEKFEAFKGTKPF
jgi:hypothetical protein